MGVDDEDDENEEMPFTVHLAQLRNGQPVLQRIEKFEPFRGRKITVNQMGCITIIYNYSQLFPRSSMVLVCQEKLCLNEVHGAYWFLGIVFFVLIVFEVPLRRRL